MESLKTCNRKNGFTLVEIIVAISILALILGFGIFLSINSYKGYIFRSEKDILVSVLDRARSRAINNIFESPHGVCLSNSNYIIFRGSVCNHSLETNEFIKANSNIAISGLSETEIIVFEQLTGNLIPPNIPFEEERKISLKQEGRPEEMISINNLGRINW